MRYYILGVAEAVQPSLSVTRLSSSVLPNVETASPTVPATPSSQDKAEESSSETVEATGQYSPHICY